MKYNYSVKFNGRWYQPNEEIPETEVEVQTEEVNENDQGTSGKSKSRNSDK